MRTPCLIIGRLKLWWVIIPEFRWATNSPARFHTIIHPPPLVGMPFTRNRGPAFHCRCNLRCKTKSSNQQSLSPWSNIEYPLCIFQILCSLFASMHANHCPPGLPIQQLNVAYGFSPLLVFEVDSKAKDKSKNQITLWEWWRSQKVSKAVSKTHADSETCSFAP